MCVIPEKEHIQKIRIIGFVGVLAVVAAMVGYLVPLRLKRRQQPPPA